MSISKEFVASLCNTKIKNLRGISINNEIQGFINLARGFKMGSLIITSIKDEPTFKIIQGMPRITYPGEKETNQIDQSLVEFPIKEDGTNITFFSVNGNAFAKTRMKPNVNDSFQALLDCFDLSNYERLVNENDCSLACELYGSSNPHLIDYTARGIDLRLDAICILKNEQAIPRQEFLDLCKRYHIPYLRNAFELKQNKLCPTNWFADEFRIDEAIQFDSLSDLYLRIEDYLQQINDQFKKEVIEGVTWHVSDAQSLKIWKCKARKIRELHQKVGDKIPFKLVEMSFYKAKENHSESLLDFVIEDLVEEIPRDMVIKHLPSITKMVESLNEKYELRQELKKIIDDFRGMPLPAAMRSFALRYPHLKKSSKIVYQILKEEKQ